jgi:hypothetical protein
VPDHFRAASARNCSVIPPAPRLPWPPGLRSSTGSSGIRCGSG